jgi:hypothetical protein
MGENALTSTGLTIQAVTDIINDLTAGLQAIYGADINVDSNTPDGQLMNIVAQAIIDQLELLVLVYNSFDPSTVSGSVEDSRFALNGLTRQGGTYTIQPVSVTANAAVSITGLNADPTGATVFTVGDGTNQYYLQTSYTFTGAGTENLLFQAVNIGAITSSLNSITTIITVTLGITSVNNPSAASVTGINEETDQQFKIRRENSFMLQSICPADSILAAIMQVPAVTDAYVYENDTTSSITMNGNTIPAHTIWCIVNGGASAAIAQAIYSKKPPCGMYGTSSNVSVVINRVQGNSLTIVYDNAVAETLYLKFNLTPNVSGVSTFDSAAIAAALAQEMVYKLNQQANSNTIITALNGIQPNATVSGCLLSTDNTNWYEIVVPVDVQHYFVLSASNITITIL